MEDTMLDAPAAATDDVPTEPAAVESPVAVESPAELPQTAAPVETGPPKRQSIVQFDEKPQIEEIPTNPSTIEAALNEAKQNMRGSMLSPSDRGMSDGRLSMMAERGSMVSSMAASERGSMVSEFAYGDSMTPSLSLNAMSTAAFSGAVDAHNALLERFKQVENTVSGVGQQQIFVLEQLQELSSKHERKTAELEERDSAQDTRLNKMEASFQEDLKAQEQKFEKRLVEAEEAQDKRLRALEEALTPQLRAVEKTMEDLISKQSEIVSRTLPQWQAELSAEIQKIATDLAKLRETTGSRDQGLEEKITASNTSWQNASKEFDARLLAEASSLKARLAASEGQLSTLAQDLTQTSERLQATHTALTEQAEAQGKQLQEFTKEEVASAKAALSTDWQNKCKGLEDALKQETFERLRNTEDVTRSLTGMTTNVGAWREDLQKQIEASTAHFSAEIKKLHVQDGKDYVLNSEMGDVGKRIQRGEEQMALLQNSLTSSDERLSNTTTALLEKLQAQSETIDKRAKAEANNALASFLAEEGAKVGELEASMRRANDERQALASSLNQEVQALRDVVAGSHQAMSARAEEAAAVVVGKLEPVKQAVSNLSQDVDELTRMQEQCEGGIIKLEDKVSGIQRKTGPIDDAQKRLLELEWYLSAERTAPFATAGAGCLSCGRNAPPQRSLSPSTSQRSYNNNSMRGGENSRSGAGLGDVNVPNMSQHYGRGQPQAPQAPQSARPTSATNYRRGIEAQAAVAQASATNYAAAQGASPAAGAAFSAARFQRMPGPGGHGASAAGMAADAAMAASMEQQMPAAPQYYRSARQGEVPVA